MTSPPPAPAPAPARGRNPARAQFRRSPRPGQSTVVRRLVAALASAAALAAAAPAAAAQAVDLELVLAVDVSSSVNRREYQLQMQGLALAFRDPGVLEAIAAHAPRGVAVSVLQWGGLGEQSLVAPWHLVRDGASAEALASRIDYSWRVAEHGGTALGDAIQVASGLFADSGFAGARRVIDVSGDGHANLGMAPELARDAALAQGIVINGLAILNEEPELDRYYGASVIGGAGAFLIVASDYEDFARAIRGKLIREIAGGHIAGRGKPAPGLAAAPPPGN